MLLLALERTGWFSCSYSCNRSSPPSLITLLMIAEKELCGRPCPARRFFFFFQLTRTINPFWRTPQNLYFFFPFETVVFGLLFGGVFAGIIFRPPKLRMSSQPPPPPPSFSHPVFSAEPHVGLNFSESGTTYFPPRADCLVKVRKKT